MDFAFLQCVYFEKFDEIETIHNLTIDLQRENYINEYFRGFLRENLCKLVQYFKNQVSQIQKELKQLHKNEGRSFKYRTGFYAIY